MNSRRKTAIACTLCVCVAGILWVATTGQRSRTTLTYSQFLGQVSGGQIAGVVVTESKSGAVEAICRLKDGRTARTVLPSNYKDALSAMQDKFVNVEIRNSSSEPLGLLVKGMPFLLLLGVWIVLMILRFPKSFGQTFPG